MENICYYNVLITEYFAKLLSYASRLSIFMQWKKTHLLIPNGQYNDSK